MKDRYDLDYEVLWDTNHYGEMMNLVSVLDANPNSETLKKTTSIDTMDTKEKRIALYKSPTAWQLTTKENSGFWPTIRESDLKLQIRYPTVLPDREKSWETELGYREFLFSIPSQLNAKGTFKDFTFYPPVTEGDAYKRSGEPGIALYSVGDKMVSTFKDGDYSKGHLFFKLNEEKFPEWDPTIADSHRGEGWNTPWVFGGSKYDYIHALKKVIPLSKSRPAPRVIKSPTNKWLFFYPEDQGDVTLYNLDYGTYFKVKGERKKKYSYYICDYTIRWSANEKFLYIYQGDFQDAALVINRETGEQNFIPQSEGVSFGPGYFHLSPGGDFLFWLGDSKSTLIEVATGRKIEADCSIPIGIHSIWVGEEVYGYTKIDSEKYSLFKAKINPGTAELSDIVYHDFKGGYYSIFSYLSELDSFVFQTVESEDLMIINRALETAAVMPLPFRDREEKFSLVPFAKGLYCARAEYYQEHGKSKKNGLILISAKGGEVKISFVPTPTAWYYSGHDGVSDFWTSSIAPFRNGKFLVMSTSNYGGPGAFVSINTETLEGKAYSGPSVWGFFKVTDSIFISQGTVYLFEVTENGDVVDITPPELKQIDSRKEPFVISILGGPYKTNPGYPPLPFTEIREITYADSETEST